MSRPLNLALLLSVRSALRKCQAKTLAHLACAAIPTQRATLASIGRAMAGGARCRHKIKSAGQFIANSRVTVADGMAGVIARLARRKGPRRWPHSIGWKCGPGTLWWPPAC